MASEYAMDDTKRASLRRRYDELEAKLVTWRNQIAYGDLYDTVNGFDEVKEEFRGLVELMDIIAADMP